MSEPCPDLPEVEPLDPEPVAVAIETARALYRTGEQLDALRWLRRAAERAEESGDDVRALNLARSAADLSTALQSVPPPPPPPVAAPQTMAPQAAAPQAAAPQAAAPQAAAPQAAAPQAAALQPAALQPSTPRASAPPPPPPPAPPPPPPPPTPRRVDEAIALSPYDDFSDKTQVDAAVPAPREVLHSRVQITELPMPSTSPRSVTMPSPPSSEPTVANAQFTPVLEVKRPSLRSAVRVAVTRDPENPGTWLTRPLAEGSEVPSGCEEALLIALDPQSRLLQ